MILLTPMISGGFKKMKINRLLLFLILLLFTAHPVSAQGKSIVINENMQYQYALKLLDEKDYDTSLVEFKRFIHFFPLISEPNSKISSCPTLLFIGVWAQKGCNKEA